MAGRKVSKTQELKDLAKAAGVVMIKSKSDLFPGMLIEKPKTATVIYDAEGEPLYKCPYCGNVADEDSCDACGAELNGLFCNQCNREFSTW